MKRDRKPQIKNITIAALCLAALLFASYENYVHHLKNKEQNLQSGQKYPAVDITLKPGQLDIRPSFETCSYYFNPEKKEDKNFIVEFKASGEKEWKRGIEPVS